MKHLAPRILPGILAALYPLAWPPVVSGQQIPTIAYCELLDHAREFNGKTHGYVSVPVDREQGRGREARGQFSSFAMIGASIR